jgi:hypothetical protein
MAVLNATFADGTKVSLSVAPVWWQWLYLGLVYNRVDATARAIKPTRVTSRPWWCFWCRPRTTTEDRSSPVDTIIIEAMGFTSNPALQQVTDQGAADCGVCSELVHSVHNIGFPVPPWAGGGGFQGVGFRASVTHRGEMKVLSGAIGQSGAFPNDFQ